MSTFATFAIQTSGSEASAGLKFGSHKWAEPKCGEYEPALSLISMNAGTANREMRRSADGRGRSARASSQTIEVVA